MRVSNGTNTFGHRLHEVDDPLVELVLIPPCAPEHLHYPLQPVLA